jgi:hypothetical protein
MGLSDGGSVGWDVIGLLVGVSARSDEDGLRLLNGNFSASKQLI